MSRARSDPELFARTRVLIVSLVIYLVTMGFMALGDRIYLGSPYLIYSRLAAIPFFLLLVLRWLRLVRVRPPEALREARQLLGLNRYRAARDKLTQLSAQLSPAQTRRVDRARRLLQDGLAVPVADEIQLEIGRCSLQLGELDRATRELEEVRARLPARADVAIDLAEALSRSSDDEGAARVLRQALPYVDAVDRETLGEQPKLLQLLGDEPLPRRSVFCRRIALERVVLGVLIAGAVVHGAHLYLGLF
jgi:tetratricopeptide (TPR) repeat protein